MFEATAYADHLILFSGDGDFTPLIEAVQRRGARVTVISTVRSNPPLAADDLRRQADNFIDLTDLSSIIGRPPRERPPVGENADQDNDDAAAGKR
jgi:uncharacterized LabA/DUF88 family protein